MKCPACDEGLPDNARFCLQCGQRLELLATSAQDVKQSSGAFSHEVIMDVDVETPRSGDGKAFERAEEKQDSFYSLDQSLHVDDRQSSVTSDSK